jgi:outer membrane receptor protein involved in Fe transport
MANSKIERAVRVALIAASAGAVAYVPAASAQEQELEQIIVTGSRIAQANLEGTSPVSVIGAQDIQFEGTVQVEDLLNNLPQAFADQGGNISNGASGTATVNLRNLGADRTLVLVNGRRMPAGSPRGPVAPDLNQIPSSLIERVEVLTGGASAVYGSDAVAGVVNFIMQDDFEGLQIDANYNAYWHQNSDNFTQRLVREAGFKKAPGEVWDGDEYSLGLTMGSNFADGRGNATLFFGYTNTDPVLQSERDYSACAISTSGLYCGGSSTSYPGRFRIANMNGIGSYSRTIDATTGLIRPFRTSGATADFYNYGPLNYYQRPQERYQAAVFAHYDVSDSAQVYTEFMFMDNSTVAQIAPSGAFGSFISPIQCSNPLLRQDGGQWLNELCTKDGIPLTGSRNVTIQRRNVEGGGRQDDLGLTSYRGVLGVKGTFADDNWNYDVSAQYGTVLFSETYQNDFSITRVQRALDVVADPTTGQPVCRSVVNGSDPNCVPWNIWTIGGVTPEALNYVATPGFQRGDTTQTVVNATVSSDLGNYGWKLPTAKDGIGIAIGAEYREEGLDFETDTAFTTGDLAGQGGPTIGVAGDYNVKDLFAEVRVPLLQDMFLAQNLTVNGSYRYSDYSLDETTNTYGIGLDWAIIDDVKFRGSYQRAVRAPNVIELYSAAGLGLYDMTRDPCSTTENGLPPTATLEQCRRTGLPDALYGGDLDSSAGQYNAIFGGNPDLKPETADTWTAGIVFTPTFVDNLAVTIDYWNIKVEDTIGTVPPSTALDQCLATGAAEYCNLITRDSQGTLWLLAEAQIIATNVNIGETKTSGWDLGVNYALEMNDWGTLSFAFMGTILDEFVNTPLPGVSSYDCAGLYGDSTCGTPLPELRTRLRTTWATPWNVDFSLNWRFFDSVDIEYSSSDPDLSDPGSVIPFSKTLDSQNYFDIAAVYTYAEKYTFNFGINNVLDETPPLSGQVGTGFGNGNTFPQVYDALGRYVFFGISAKF